MEPLRGLNDFKRIGYGGPCPPPGKPHRYLFKLYALDTILDLKPRETKAHVLQAYQGHILAEAQLMGRYGRESSHVVHIAYVSTCVVCESRVALPLQFL